MKSRILKIEVLGSGCPKCEKLLELSQEVLKELNLDLEIDYVKDIERMIALGIMSTPALAINDKAVLSGYLPTKDEIAELIKKYLN